MNTSYPMQFVMARAKSESKHGGRSGISIEDVFLGLLKLSEIQAADFLHAPAETLRDADEEICELRRRFTEEYKIDTTRLRALLRRELTQGLQTDAAGLAAALKRAEEYAARRGGSAVCSLDAMDAVIEKPTDALRQVCAISDWGKKQRKEENGKLTPEKAEEAAKEDAQKTAADEMNRDFLPKLTSRVRRMRAKLLETVQGQDHVVHAFAEGMFAAEVLAASDEKRQRPRAIFVFAGPPGVGKTFLAEQAAEALSLPFKRFDMSTYADHQSYMGLVGFEPSYKDAKPGILTGFVKDNPHSILLFDEIEKAHLNTVQLFLQILDAGRLADRYLDKDISFRDTIIVFTSNAGRSLYGGDAKQNAAGVPRSVLLRALETETDPRTGRPFFPAAIISRMATGWPMLFNHLQANDLAAISRREFSRFCGLFEKQYGIPVKYDDLLPTALMYREGQTDARTLRAQAELFFKNEMFKLCRLWGEDNFPEAVKRLRGIGFHLEIEALPSEIRPLFFSEEKQEILLYGDLSFAERCRKELPDYVFHDTQNVDEALAIAGERDIRLVLLDPAEPSTAPGGFMKTVCEDIEREGLLLSGGAFDFAPMASGLFQDGLRLFRALRERLPELPVYLLETPDLPIDEELTMSFVRAGVRGKLVEPEGDFSVFEDILSDICRQLYMQAMAIRLTSERKTLGFDTAPQLSSDRHTVTIRMRDFSLRRSTAAEDAGSVLDEAEKPGTRFADVIGASDAKDELKFFIDYLKNPKKFSSRGLKPPKGVLLYGPPGTGKTMLARAMAGESDVAFIPTAASSFVTKWQGSGPEAVRALFQRARRNAPAIVFIDEIDAIGRKRGESNSGHGEEMALNALLTEMDGFAVDPRRPVFVLAATNFDVEEGRGGPGVIDPALSRRFDRKVLVDLPNAGEREELLRMLLDKNAEHAVTEAMIHRTAHRAMGMSPANLTSVVELANRLAVKAGKRLDNAVFDEAFEMTKHGAKKDWSYEYLERVARHESGHAFLCWRGGNTPSYLTIVARGGHGGYMEHDAKDMGPLHTKEELIHRIRTSLGGRAAEIVYYGEAEGISTGASGDLEQATQTAAAMLCSYGMDEEFGLAAFGARELARDPAVKKRVNDILREEMRNTVEIIRGNQKRIDRMVNALMQKNKLTGDEIEQLLRED